MKFRILLLSLCVACVAGARADELRLQRDRFKPAYDAALAGRDDAIARGQGLQHYPLYPYLRYLSLKRRLDALPVAQVEEFLRDEQGSYLESRLRGEWLRLLGQQHRWALLDHFSVATTDPLLGCLALRARLELGKLTALTPEIEALWLVGTSQSEVCDPVFEHLRQRGTLTSTLVQRRVWLALGDNRPQLASFLLRRFAPTPTMTARLTKLRAQPEQVLDLGTQDADSPQARAVVGYAVATLAAKDAGRAQSLWRKVRSRYHFEEQEAGVLLRAIALGAVAQVRPERLSMLDNVPAAAVTPALERLRLREALQARDWTRLAAWTALAPNAENNGLRWRYWHARALAALGKMQEATQVYQALAQERDYYGFLASDQLGLAYSMGHQPVAPTASELAEVGADRAVARAREFYRLGLRAQANQEWQWAISHLPRREVEVAAHLAHDWGWFDRAIIALGAVQSYDDLELRFPLLFEDTVRSAARRRGLPPALIYSIIRGESAFVVDARSGAGALGLMQMLPSTGEETARSLGIGWRDESALLEPDKNIMLGSEYLRRVLRQFNGSFPLAAAAYNAGPSRVKSWLPRDSCTPPDVWVELIPFIETEGYVRRALFYAAVYEHRMGEKVNALSERLADITRVGAGGGHC